MSRPARARYVRALKGAAEEDWAGEGPGGLPWWRLGRPPKGEEQEVPKPDSAKAYVDVFGRGTGLEKVRDASRGLCRSGVRFSRCVSRGAQLRQADAEFKARINELDQLLAMSLEPPADHDETS